MTPGFGCGDCNPELLSDSRAGRGRRGSNTSSAYRSTSSRSPFFEPKWCNRCVHSPEALCGQPTWHALVTQVNRRRTYRADHANGTVGSTAIISPGGRHLPIKGSLRAERQEFPCRNAVRLDAVPMFTLLDSVLPLTATGGRKKGGDHGFDDL